VTRACREGSPRGSTARVAERRWASAGGHQRRGLQGAQLAGVPACEGRPEVRLRAHGRRVSQTGPLRGMAAVHAPEREGCRRGTCTRARVWERLLNSFACTAEPTLRCESGRNGQWAE
jgi:hypothetical protein